MNCCGSFTNLSRWSYLKNAMGCFEKTITWVFSLSLSLSLSERRYQKKSTGKIEQALKLRVRFVISCDMIVFSFFTISGQLTLKVNLKTNQTAIKQSWNFYLDCVISPGQVFPCMFGKAGFVSFFVCRKHSNKLHKESGNFHI